jgi:zinc protease
MRQLRLISVFFFIFFLAAAISAQTLPPGVEKVTSIEGVTEYSFPNGLHALLFPDNSKPKITVNVVYRVGSRNEGYGETGMAHLLEHMNFKTTTSGRSIFAELSEHSGGGNFQGATSYDQTVYYEILNAGDDNLRWALALEADRMVNMTMLGKDLVTEMPVVRNEMEMGENSPERILFERVLGAAYNFHNYGKTIIGARADVERVPIANLAVFYKKYYQPDNADVVIAGQFDETKALAFIADTLGKIPKPDRVLTQPYTVEPTQEGEREVVLRRVGTTQQVLVVYHVPAALHPDIAPLDVLTTILGEAQTGRLYKALVESKLAVATSMDVEEMHDPGWAEADADLKPDQSIDDARKVLVKTIEDLPANPPTQEEVDRAKARIEKHYDLMLANSQSIGLELGSSIGVGDWRTLFLDREEIAKVTPADVLRVAKAYLKSSNRTLGEFIPTATPDRAEIPPTPSPADRFKDFKGGAAEQQGEVFDPTPANIEARVQRSTLPNGIKLVLFPKKTRGGMVSAVVNIRFGDEKSLFGKSTDGELAGALLMRGTKTLNKQQIQDETDRLKAQININGSVNGANANIRTSAANLPDALRLVRDLFRESTFPDAEFEQVRLQHIEGAESGKTDPQTLVTTEFGRHMNEHYPKGDVRYVDTLDESIDELKAAKLDDVRQFYHQFYGPGEGEIVISGQFDPAEIKKLVGELFGDWKSPAKYERIKRNYMPVEAINKKIETPDKQNSLFFGGGPIKINDDSPDAAALTIAGMVFGGTPESRLFARIRIKDGLSYGVGARYLLPAVDDGAALSVFAISAPQNTPKVEVAFNEELQKALKDGFTDDEVTKAKKMWLDQQTVSRTEEGSIAGLLASRERWGRTMDWDAKREAAMAAVTTAQVNAAFKKYMDSLPISIVKGGDFKKANAYQ